MLKNIIIMTPNDVLDDLIRRDNDVLHAMQ